MPNICGTPVWVLLNTLLLAVPSVALVAFPVSQGEPGASLVLSPMSLGLLLLAVRAARSGVAVDAVGVSVRGVLRTRRVAWSEVKGLTPYLEYRGGALLAVTTNSGSRLTTTGLQPLDVRGARAAALVAQFEQFQASRTERV